MSEILPEIQDPEQTKAAIGAIKQHSDKIAQIAHKSFDGVLSDKILCSLVHIQHLLAVEERQVHELENSLKDD